MAITQIKGPQGHSFRDFLRTIFSKKSVILASILVVTLLALIISLLTPPKYETATKILAKERKAENPLDIKNYFEFRTERVAFLQSQMEIIQSEEVAKRVLRKLTPDKQEVSQKEIKAFLPKIKVFSPKGFDITSSDILFVQISDHNPVRAADLANTLTDEYINYTYELKGKSAKQIINFLEKQSQVTLDKLKAMEEQVKTFEGKAGPDLAFLIATVKAQGPNTELISYNTNYVNAKASLMETESYLNQLRALLRKGVVPNKLIRENLVLSSIKDNITKLQNQLANLRSQYTDQYPKNIMLLKEIENNKKILKQELDADLDGRYVDVIALEARIKSLKETVDQYTALAQKQLEYSRIYKIYDIENEQYQNLQRDIEKAKTAEAMETYKLASIEIIDRAKVPKSPVSPNIILNILIGAVIGLLLGLGLAFVLESFDHTLKSVEDVEWHLNMPVLGSIPRQ
ncbi:MAG: Wzz/FepE/Etk N-terminal domain-containing protein [Thermodesulfobacteriota bacterium]